MQSDIRPWLQTRLPDGSPGWPLAVSRNRGPTSIIVRMSSKTPKQTLRERWSRLGASGGSGGVNGPGHRYTILVASFLVMMISWGIYVTYGVFLNPLAEEFGWSRATISGAYSLSLPIGGVLGIAAGWATDRLGPRIVVTISGVLIGAGYMLMSRIDSVWALYVYFGVLVGIGMSGLWVPLLSTVARWFTKRRSLATGFAISGVTLGQVIAPPIISRMIIAFGWRCSCFAVGVASLAVIIIGAQFLRKDPGARAPLPAQGDTTGTHGSTVGLTLREAACTKQFWMVSVTFFLVGIGAFGLFVHLVPHVIDLGISGVSAATVLAVNGGVGIPGSFLVGGLLGDRIGNRRAFIIGLVPVIVSLLFLVPARQLWALYVVAIVFGVGIGGMTTSESPLVARLFGLRHHGSIYAVTGLGYTAGGALGPLLWGYMFDSIGSYVPAFLLSAGCGALGLVLLMLLKPTQKLSSVKL